jgi:predicted transcriptional regulator YheO
VQRLEELAQLDIAPANHCCKALAAKAPRTRTDTVTAPPEKFQDDWHERINRFIAAWTAKRATTIDRLDRNARRALIEALHASDAFVGRRATVYVAQVLGISRATMYNELARLKGKVAA